MKAWVFDLDGTLVDSSSLYIEAVGDVFREHGLNFGDDEFRLGLVTSPRDLLRRFLGEERGPRALVELQKRFNEDAGRIRLFHGAEDFLATLSENGYRIGIWTARERETAEVVFAANGLSRFASHLVSGDCVTQGKPHPEGLNALLEKFGCRAQDAVMIGDHEHDMLAARAAGTRAIRAAWSPHYAVHTTERCSLAHDQFATIQGFSEWIEGRPWSAPATLNDQTSASPLRSGALAQSASPTGDVP